MKINKKQEEKWLRLVRYCQESNRKNEKQVKDLISVYKGDPESSVEIGENKRKVIDFIFSSKNQICKKYQELVCLLINVDYMSAENRSKDKTCSLKFPSPVIIKFPYVNSLVPKEFQNLFFLSGKNYSHPDTLYFESRPLSFHNKELLIEKINHKEIAEIMETIQFATKDEIEVFMNNIYKNQIDVLTLIKMFDYNIKSNFDFSIFKIEG